MLRTVKRNAQFRMWLVAAWLLTSVWSCSAQQFSGKVSAHVVDFTGAAIFHADVFVRDVSGSSFDLTTHTDGRGDFQLTLPAGGYDVVVVSRGFQTSVQAIPVKPNKVYKALWKMKVLPCDFPGTVCDTFQ